MAVDRSLAEVTPDPLPTPDQYPITRITALIRDAVSIDIQDPTTDLLENGIIDSLAFVSLLLAIEEEFGMPIDVATLDLADFQTVERITRFINLQITRSNSSAGG